MALDVNKKDSGIICWSERKKLREPLKHWIVLATRRGSWWPLNEPICVFIFLSGLSLESLNKRFWFRHLTERAGTLKWVGGGGKKWKFNPGSNLIKLGLLGTWCSCVEGIRPKRQWWASSDDEWCERGNRSENKKVIRYQRRFTILLNYSEAESIQKAG